MKKYLFIFIAILVSGCVSPGTYSKKMELCKKVEDERDFYKEKVADLRERNRELEKSLSMGEEEQAELKEEIAARDQELEEMSGTYDNLIVELKDYIAEGNVGIVGEGDDLTISLGNQILFRSGQTRLQPKGMEVLKAISGVLKTVEDRNILVEGHSDNVPVTGTLKKRYPSNWELSAMRSAAVVRYLQESGEIPPDMLILAAYGEHQPIASNATSMGRRQNRRVEISLVKKGLR